MRIYRGLALIFLIIAAMAAVAVYIEIPYNISTRGVVMPVREWRLTRLADGSILNTEKNNLTNSIASYSVLEFQRGDHAEFMANEKVISGKTINKDDTVGYIRSYEEERRLLELTGALEEQKRLLRVSLTGEKEEEINAARQNLILAETEFETQKKLVARMESLHETGVIADEAWELALNDYLIKEQNMNIARSELEVVSTGAKPEEIDRIRAIIDSYQRQIEQIRRRIETFSITAPFAGTVIKQQGTEPQSESIIRVADLENLIVTLPVDLYQLTYIDTGNTVNLTFNSRGNSYRAKVTGVDNAVQYIDQKQNIFITAIIEDEPERFMPNMLVQAEIVSGSISAWDYIKRMFKVIFEN